MKKRVIAGVLVAASMAAGVFAYSTMEKGSVSNASKLNMDAATGPVSEADLAFAANQEEEKYIAKLVSNKTGVQLDTSDWETCLEYLEANYDTIMADDAIDSAKVESYVEGYKILKEDNKLAEITGGIEATGANPGLANYDVNKVTEYIANNWERYNPDYPCFTGWGGDCANFVSQCLYAGGMQMVGSNASRFSNWFCRTNVAEEFSKTSSTWRGAEAFASYWSKNALEYKQFDNSCFKDKLAFNEIYRYSNVGYAMSFINTNGRAYHTTIVNLKNRDGDREIRFAAHSSFNWEKSLYEYGRYNGMSVRVYRMSTPSPELEASYDYDMENIQVEVVDSKDPSTWNVDEEENKGFWNRFLGNR